MTSNLIIQPNTFYRVKDVDEDFSPRTYYGDTYDGHADAGDITTAANAKFYLAKSVAPPLPAFTEEPRFSSLHLKYYPNTVSSSNSLANPRLKTYVMKQPLNLTEGAITVLEEDIASFCSYKDWEGGWMTENFNSVNKGFSDRANYSKQVHGITSHTRGRVYKISADGYRSWLSDQGFYRISAGGPYRNAHVNTGEHLKLEQRVNNEGFFVDDYVVTQIMGDEVESDHKSAFAWKSVGDHASFTSDRYNMNENRILEYGGILITAHPAGRPPKTYNVYDTDFVGKVTQFNSIFNAIKESPDAEDIKVQTTGDAGDDDKFYTYSRFILNPKEKLTGGNSGQITQLWENYSGNNTAYARIFGNTVSGGTSLPLGSSGAALPQCVMASMDFFPQPIPGDGGGVSGSTPWGKERPDIAAQEMEFKMKIEKMPPVTYLSGSVAPLAFLGFQRAFFITFSSEPPESTDNFYTWLTRLAHDYRTGAQKITATGLMFYQERPGDVKLGGDDDVIQVISFLDRGGLGESPLLYLDGMPFVDYPAYPYSRFPLMGPSLRMEVPKNEWFTMRFKFPSQCQTPWTSGDNNIQVYCPDVLVGEPKPDTPAAPWLPGVTFDNWLGYKGAMASGTLHLDDWPKKKGSMLDLNNMTLWSTNFRAVPLTDPDHISPTIEPDNAGFRDDDMEQSVLIDSITMRNFNNKIFNTSVNSENIGAGYLTLAEHLTVPQWSGSSKEQPISGNLSLTDNYFGMENTPAQTNFCFGFETFPAELSGANGTSLLFNNYGTAGLAPENISDFYISGSYSWSGGVNLSGQKAVPATRQVGSATGYFDISGGTSSVDAFVQKGFVGISGTFVGATKRENPYCAARVIAANADGTEIVVDNPSIFDFPAGRAEAGGTEYVMWMVDNPRSQDSPSGARLPWNNFSDAYLSGSGSVGFSGAAAVAAGNPVNQSLYQRKPRAGNVISLNRATRTSDLGDFNMTATNPFGGAGITTGAVGVLDKSRLGSIFISPKKYWFNLHIMPGQGDSKWGEWYAPSTTIPKYKPVTTRSYQTVLLISGMVNNDSAQGTPGSTFNEYLFTDGFNQREWMLTPDDMGVFQTTIDYGYGVYAPATDTAATTNPEVWGGYISIDYPEVSTSSYVDLTSYINVSDPGWESEFDFALYPFFEDANAYTHYTINVDNKEGTNPPELIWGIEDTLPDVSDLVVGPAVDVLKMEDPLSQGAASFNDIKFTWSEMADDIWYRLLYIKKDTTINNKYLGRHDASTNAPFGAWIPLNESGTTHSSLGNIYPKAVTSGAVGLPMVYMSGSEVLPGNIEGFQGYGALWPGDASMATGYGFEDMGFSSLEEFTFVAHCKPWGSDGVITDSGVSGTALYDHSMFKVWMEAGKIHYVASGTGTPAMISGSSTTTYILTDSTPVEANPLAIVLSYHTRRPSNHMQLHINGILEDAVTLTTPGYLFPDVSTPWYVSQITIGGNASGNTETFNDKWLGYMEEIIFYNRCLYVVPNSEEYIFDTTPLLDQTGAQSHSWHAKLFAFDYHNIRGESPKEVASTNSVAWKVTTV